MWECIQEGLVKIFLGIVILLVCYLILAINFIFISGVVIGCVAILLGLYEILDAIYQYIVGWRFIERSEIPHKILKLLDSKAQRTASFRRKLKGYKRHIRVGNIVYRIVVPSMAEVGQHAWTYTGPIRYYRKKV